MLIRSAISLTIILALGACSKGGPKSVAPGSLVNPGTPTPINIDPTIPKPPVTNVTDVGAHITSSFTLSNDLVDGNISYTSRNITFEAYGHAYSAQGFPTSVFRATHEGVWNQFDTDEGEVEILSCEVEAQKYLADGVTLTTVATTTVFFPDLFPGDVANGYSVFVRNLDLDFSAVDHMALTCDWSDRSGQYDPNITGADIQFVEYTTKLGHPAIVLNITNTSGYVITGASCDVLVRDREGVIVGETHVTFTNYGHDPLQPGASVSSNGFWHEVNDFASFENTFLTEAFDQNAKDSNCQVQIAYTGSII